MNIDEVNLISFLLYLKPFFFSVTSINLDEAHFLLFLDTLFGTKNFTISKLNLLFVISSSQASIVFKVTDGPFYGHLYVEDEVKATRFYQYFWK